MIDVLGLAKSIIQKGKDLNDPQLIQMGYDMLSEPPVVDETKLEVPKYDYVCSFCGQNISFTEPNRKKCPKCKKHQLVIRPIESPPTNIISVEDFEMQIRHTPPKENRIRYNDQGEQEGIYARTEQIGNITNVWNDDGIEGHDEEDERLKKISKKIPRNRPPIKMISVVCEFCKKPYTVHPIHAGGRGRYLCDKCISKRSKI